MAEISLNFYLEGDYLQVGAAYVFDSYFDPETGEELFSLTYSIDWNDGEYVQTGYSPYPGGVAETYTLPTDQDGTFHLVATGTESWTGATASVEYNVIFALHGNDDAFVSGTSGDDAAFSGGTRNLVVLGSGNDQADLGAGNDIAWAGAGSDIVNGGAGNDVMRGGAGDDFYYIDSANDRVVERPDAGTDSVWTSVSLTLSANLENLYLGGDVLAINGTGNELANSIVGNAGDNRLAGAEGDDTLSGGYGSDTYVFADGDGHDTIAYFEADDSGHDHIDLTGVAGVDDFDDLDVIVDGSSVTIDYGTGSFTIAFMYNPAGLGADDFTFA